MKHYFFNIETPSGTLDSQVGTMLPSHEKAAELAEASMHELIANAYRVSRPAARAVRVVDDFGRAIPAVTAIPINDRVL